MSHSSSVVSSHGTSLFVCKHAHRVQDVQIVPVAANHWDPKLQRGRLPSKLSPLSFPSGLSIERNSDWLLSLLSFLSFATFNKAHISLEFLVATQMMDAQNPSINCTNSMFHSHTVLHAWDRWQKRVAFSDGILAIRVSGDNHTIWAHYSRQRVIAYLLHADISIEMDWPFSSVQWLLHHVWRVIYWSHVNPAHIH